jgi:DNA modification methylase
VLVGDARAVLAGLPEASVHTCVCSPPYFGLRNYSTEPVEWGGSPDCQHVWTTQAIRDRHGDDGLAGNLEGSRDSQAQTRGDRQSDTCSLCGCWRGELGAEPDPDLYCAHLVEVFSAVKRVLRRDGQLWCVIGDSFAGNPASGGIPSPKLTGAVHQRTPKESRGRPPGLRDKELIGIPWLFAFAMRRDGWLIRQELCWSKTSAMPESVQDRCTRSHETIFMFVKQGRYFYDATAIAEPVAQSSIQRVSQNDGHPVYNGDRQRGFPGQPQTLDINCTVPESGLRNKRSVWVVSPAPFSARDLGIEDCDHYAAYPPALVDPMVRAGTSEKGVCAACGAPWRRVVERVTNWQERRKAGAWAGNVGVAENYQNNVHGKGMSHDLDSLGIVHRGWIPTCGCNAGDPRPATVLDPFTGSGTTLMVADRLGRDAIGIELRPEYADMALKRVEADRRARDPILREQAAARAGGWTAPTLFPLDAAE